MCYNYYYNNFCIVCIDMSFQCMIIIQDTYSLLSIPSRAWWNHLAIKKLKSCVLNSIHLLTYVLLVQETKLTMADGSEKGLLRKDGGLHHMDLGRP